MEYLEMVWKFIVFNILTKPAYLIGFMVFLGYILLKKPWYESLSGFIKATVGYFILAVGSGGLVRTFRPILVGLKEKFNLSAMVIDPYFGQNAVQSAMTKLGRSFSQVMILLLIAFIFNLILVRLQKFTKLRAVFTTGHVQMQQAATAFWLILYAFPGLGDTPMLIIMAILLGTYWAVGSNLTIKPTQEVTDGAGFALAHQQMFGVYLMSKLSEYIGKKSKNSKKLEDIELPGWLSIFNDNMVSTSLLMTVFFGTILLILGQDYLIAAKFLKQGDSFAFYILTTALQFAVYLAILQLGVRTFVTELTVSFQGISNKLLPGAVPGIDCAAVYGFGSPNAITIGFLFGALGQFLAIITLILLKSPTIVIAGFVPVFFDNATIGVFANNKGGLKAAIITPFISGLIQVFGSAFIASLVGLSLHGGYLGMFDWATVWPAFTIIMKYLGYVGVGIITIVLLIIPQLQYKKDKENYFLITSDYEQYKKNKNK
ncbi:PTS ascorbate transporter subunit IIC [Helcococcus ovis]|uniref:PTS ascorbate transporter subunit IIC n=1 Tax=Helcococcus ovis TaxID=72026 RepID=UPI00106FA6AC|nr:PTS ascorbate transporter subunit IIC [Helcococcus ovis]TFF66514.1 PTS ascorbate transporter subunit IIC [Helcococcus ovis]WNZ01671.1 PTS ascorbate transporter subunit IIC [Helcococcus ovis]